MALKFSMILTTFLPFFWAFFRPLKVGMTSWGQKIELPQSSYNTLRSEFLLKRPHSRENWHYSRKIDIFGPKFPHSKILNSNNFALLLSLWFPIRIFKEKFKYFFGIKPPPRGYSWCVWHICMVYNDLKKQFRRHSSTGKEGFVPRNYLGMWPRIKATHGMDN